VRGGHPRGAAAGAAQPHRRDRGVPRLGREELARIVEIQLGRLSKLLSDKQLKLELTDRAKQAVGRRIRPGYGARAQARVQRLVLTRWR